MPEGPECRRVYEGLRHQCNELALVEVSVLGGRFLKKRPAGLDSLTLPAKVIGGGVHGKFIWLQLEGSQSCWITLGMSGFWSTRREQHAHIALKFNDGTCLYFIDQRRFGTLRFGNMAELDKKLKTLGLDLLNDAEVTPADFILAIKQKPNRTIVEALMDQRVCAGVGNYIKCEVLYRARIAPTRKVSSLSDADLTNIFGWARSIMQASYLQGGASIRNYRQIDDSVGEFVFEFEVYSKRQDSLGNPVVRDETPDGRTTHWVPAVQR